VIVLTDIGNEPDDSESFVRFLLHANAFDGEGLVATTSTLRMGRAIRRGLRGCGASGRVAQVAVPADATPVTYHVVLEVTDDGSPR
jgi:hypothetical protein